jgi:superfamily II RNA helicase
MDPNIVAGLASKRTYPLVSPFRPTYNMSVNLVAAFGRERAREVLETSFVIGSENDPINRLPLIIDRIEG